MRKARTHKQIVQDSDTKSIEHAQTDNRSMADEGRYGLDSYPATRSANAIYALVVVGLFSVFRDGRNFILRVFLMTLIHCRCACGLSAAWNLFK